MVSPLFFYQLVLVALVWLCVMLHWAWPSDPAAVCPTTPEPPGPLPKHNREPTPFAGLTCKPPCAACEQAHEHVSQPPGCPPPRIVPTRGRPRQVVTSFHFCPDVHCDYQGWVGLGNLSANGLPTICQPSFVNFFTPSARLAHDESGSHHSRYVHAAWPSGYATTGPQDFSKPGHGAAPSPATPHTRC